MRLILISAVLLAWCQLYASGATADENAAGAAPTSAARRGAEKSTDAAPTLRVAAVQMRSSRDVNDNLERTKKSIEQCARQGVRVVVFPECSLTGYFDDGFMKAFSADALAGLERQVAGACKQHNVYAVVGMPWREGDKLYNSAIVIDDQGHVVERFHKLHLAERWPDAGDHLAVFTVDGVLCSIIVCHDERYPELVRLPVLAGARCIFCISHESGLAKENKIAPYRAQIQARAVENTVFVVQANAPANADATGSHGQSRIAAPDGNIRQEATIFGEDVLIDTLELSKATGHMAQGSVKNGPLADWWREGLKHVRVIGPRAAEGTEKRQ